MLTIFTLVAIALDPTSSSYSPTACAFVSARGADVVAYADTKIGDEGDVLAGFHVAPGERSMPIEPGQGKLRYKYRAGKNDRWTYAYTVDCGPNKPVQLP